MLKQHETLYEHYRTIAYERANPAQEVNVSAQDKTFAALLPESRNACILDVGCGMGQFLVYLALKGYRNISGIELSKEQVDSCLERMNCVSHVTDTISFLSERPGSWDCIVFNDVIEHLPRKEVIPTLSAMFHALAPGGSVIIETGNLASPAGMFVRHIDFTHESGFTENSLRQVLRAVGFSDISIRGNAPPIFSWRSYLRIAIQLAFHFSLRAMYSIDRGWGAAPKILSPLLIARAVKH